MGKFGKTMKVLEILENSEHFNLSRAGSVLDRIGAGIENAVKKSKWKKEVYAEICKPVGGCRHCPYADIDIDDDDDEDCLCKVFDDLMNIEDVMKQVRKV